MVIEIQIHLNQNQILRLEQLITPITINKSLSLQKPTAKHPALRSVWSKCGDLNSVPPGPKPGALPGELHLEIFSFCVEVGQTVVKLKIHAFLSFSKAPKVRTVKGFSGLSHFYGYNCQARSQSKRAPCCNCGSVCVSVAPLPIAKLLPLLIPPLIRHRRRSETSPTAPHLDI